MDRFGRVINVVGDVVKERLADGVHKMTLKDDPNGHQYRASGNYPQNYGRNERQRFNSDLYDDNRHNSDRYHPNSSYSGNFHDNVNIRDSHPQYSSGFNKGGRSSDRYNYDQYHSGNFSGQNNHLSTRHNDFDGKDYLGRSTSTPWDQDRTGYTAYNQGSDFPLDYESGYDNQNYPLSHKGAKGEFDYIPSSTRGRYNDDNNVYERRFGTPSGIRGDNFSGSNNRPNYSYDNYRPGQDLSYGRSGSDYDNYHRNQHYSDLDNKWKNSNYGHDYNQQHFGNRQGFFDGTNSRYRNNYSGYGTPAIPFDQDQAPYPFHDKHFQDSYMNKHSDSYNNQDRDHDENQGNFVTNTVSKMFGYNSGSQPRDQDRYDNSDYDHRRNNYSGNYDNRNRDHDENQGNFVTNTVSKMFGYNSGSPSKEHDRYDNRDYDRKYHSNNYGHLDNKNNEHENQGNIVTNTVSKMFGYNSDSHPKEQNNYNNNNQNRQFLEGGQHV